MEGQDFGYSSEKLGRPLPRYALPRAKSYPIYWDSSNMCPSELTVFTLENIDMTVLNSMNSSDEDIVFEEARLVPISIDRICVMAGTTIIGDLPHSTVILNTQIARIYASGCVPTCLLSINPDDAKALAKVHLRTDAYAVPVNNPPESKWVLLSSGTLWPAEPLITSAFRSLPLRAQVLMEIRVVDDVALLYLNGVECAILAINSLSWVYSVHNYFTKRGLVPVVRAYVTRDSTTGAVELCVDALKIGEWTKEKRDLAPNPLATLMSFRSDPLEYPPVELPADATFPRSVSPHTHMPLEHKKLLRLVAIIVGMWCMAFGLSLTDLNSHHAVGFGILGILSTVLGGWAWNQRRHPKGLRQHRFWSCLGPIAVSTALPSLAFATIGFFLEAPTTSHHSELIPMRTFPTAPLQLPTENSRDVTEDIQLPDIAEPQALYQATPPILPSAGSVALAPPATRDSSETARPADETAPQTPDRHKHHRPHSHESETGLDSINVDPSHSAFIPAPISPAEAFTPPPSAPTSDAPNAPLVADTNLLAGASRSCIASFQEESATVSLQGEADD